MFNPINEMLKKWYPDACTGNQEICEKKTIEILYAKETIMNFCENFKISFSKEEVEKYLSPAEFWQKRFGSDPIWSDNFDTD